MNQLSRFRIEGLYNARTIDLSINDNVLVLVGENGTGKSTVVNMLYFFLTSQWNRIAEVPFKKIVSVVDGKEYILDKYDIRTLAEKLEHSRFSSRLPRRVTEKLESLAVNLSEAELVEAGERLAKEFHIPYRLLRPEIKRMSRIPKEKKGLVKDLEAVNPQVLYLPTYRRIEQDLEKVLPGLDIDDFEKRKRFLSSFLHKRNYIELVEFGMEDVVRTIQKRTTEIEKKVRADLSNLTGEYLRDVIRGSYQSADLSQLKDVDEGILNEILSRTPEEMLQAGDKTQLRQIVDEVKSAGKVAKDNQIVAHFLTSLLQLYQKQREDERAVRNFIEICNDGYLTGKKFRYDTTAFDVELVQEGSQRETPLPISALSSGEKQIVSLFSHLYLSGLPNPFVIIDEPELSLSVPWQRRFLPDILEKSSGLISVTHSPFIYDNSLREYTHSLEEFTEPFEYDPSLEEASISEYDDIPF